jgi:hypothetical protein
VGDGIPFLRGTAERSLRLVEEIRFPSGVVFVGYNVEP